MPLDTYTKLLSHFNGTDGATTYTAETGQTITFAETAQLDTAQKKFNSASLLLDGNSDYVTIPDNANWDLIADTTDYTIDFFVKHTDHAGEEVYMTQWEDTNNRWGFKHTDGTGLIFEAISGGVGIISIQGGGEITDTNWHHVALVKISSTYHLYLDGVEGTSATDASTDTFAGNLYIGAVGDPAAYFDGWIDEVRISRGIARWTANFTPPTQEYGSGGGIQCHIY